MKRKVKKAILLAMFVAVCPAKAELPPFSGGAPLSESTCSDPAIIDVEPIPPGDFWKNYLIMIWQFKTSAVRDVKLYEEAGFHGFHIDRGAGQGDKVQFASENNFPYYVDHLADKGILHLTERTGVDQVLKKRELVARPNSLARSDILAELKGHIEKNIEVTKKGPVVAYSFDDEISLGSFNSPAEVDASPESVALFRKWLERKYISIQSLNQSWGTNLGNFEEAGPVSFEGIRKAHSSGPFRNWKLAQWMDWRSYMDSQFASVLGELSRYSNSIDPTTPAGFVGGQTPSAFGGFDYEKLCRSVQFMESYDIGGTNEILRSFWNGPERRPFVQTWFSTGNQKKDSWFLWYYLVHGNRGMIAWPDTGGKTGSWFQEGKGLLPHLKELAPTSREVQGPVSKSFLSTKATFDSDPIAVYYSMPSVRASWVTDVIPHGGTWPNRSSSLDNRCQSAAKNRVAWFKLLEDCGYQYQVVSSAQVSEDHLVQNGYRVLILNRALCLSDNEIDSIQRFVDAGGTLVADHWTGLLDENGNGRNSTATIDRLFGIERKPLSGYFGSDILCELNGEKYKEPYLQRLEYEKAKRVDGIVLVGETESDGSSRKNVHFLDLSPLEYFDNEWRNGPGGDAWRKLLSDILAKADLTPRAEVYQAGVRIPTAEVLHWKNEGKRVLAVVMNPVREGSITSAGAVIGVTGEPFEAEIRFPKPRANIKNLRTGKSLPDGNSVHLEWRPWEALVIQTD